MSALIKTINSHDNESDKQQFMQDVLYGLSKTQKQIPSKYFYDERGSRLFNQITRHPDYYLTACEIKILHYLKGELSNLLEGNHFNLIELGPGEGLKSQLLIEQFIKDNLTFHYFTIDVSANYLLKLMRKIYKKFPALITTSIHSDYMQGIKQISLQYKLPNLVLFLGSSIGNFTWDEAKYFLKKIRQFLHEGDYLLIGFDLRKKIDVMLRAYNDSNGITKAFNFNLLRRMNKELNANFQLDTFDHYAPYNPYQGAMESYLISLYKQEVVIETLDKSFLFEQFEPIQVEYSYKYLPTQITLLAEESNFDIVKNFNDQKGYFVNSLWKAKVRT